MPETTTAPKPARRRPCRRPGCPSTTSPWMFACPSCWSGLPREIRYAISAAWRAGGSGARAVLTDAYRAAAERAMAYWGSLDG